MSGDREQIRVLGVHPVPGQGDVNLVEIEVAEACELDWSQITQVIKGVPESEWQVAWDERLIESNQGVNRFAFFFHRLQLNQPLKTQLGLIELPRMTITPKHLLQFDYEAP